ncbi:MAG: hypothetical protein II527_08205 [Bacteroidales bacterium]|jgi:hypothetical protein|nr:hypothetical protein [Bacteroidales bacterium]MBQ2483458.1 hypothetical protein [Bacteroidales bacterium]MBQ2493297.1 hypothetical protein [Bacteroidales bacterium]
MKARKAILILLAAIVCCSKAPAQDLDALGTFTPYSLFGVGDLHGSNTASLLGMGGIGMGIRDPRYINVKNIASITERDTLSFMLDFGMYGKNMYLKDRNTKSAFNSVNINNFVISVPIKDKHSLLFGVMPFSNMGYKFETEETDAGLISKYGDIKYRKYGNGNINQLFLGGAVKINKNISAGIQGIYYFGSQTNHSDVVFSNSEMRTIVTGWKFTPHSFSFEAAVQGTFNPAEDYTLTAGASYRMKNKLRGSVTRYAYLTDGEVSDTVAFNPSKSGMSIPSRFAVGVVLTKGDKWKAGLDYERQDWTKAGFGETPGVAYKAQTAQSVRVGIEFVPNRYDIRYRYKRMTYRAGFHYDKSYVSLDGKSINQMGITLGTSIPVYRLNNSFNIAVDFGQRGSKTGNLVRENYINFILSISLHDLWFIKPKYQ